MPFAFQAKMDQYFSGFHCQHDIFIARHHKGPLRGAIDFEWFQSAEEKGLALSI